MRMQHGANSCRPHVRFTAQFVEGRFECVNLGRVPLCAHLVLQFDLGLEFLLLLLWSSILAIWFFKIPLYWPSGRRTIVVAF